MQDLAHFMVLFVVVLGLAAVMASILFCEHNADLGSVGGMFGWALKLAILGDGGGIVMASYSNGAGLDVSGTEVRISCRLRSSRVNASLRSRCQCSVAISRF